MSFLKNQYEKIKLKINRIVKLYGKRVALTFLMFFIVAVVSVGIIWLRLRTFSKEFISLPPITDPNIVDPIKSNDLDDIGNQIIVDPDLNDDIITSNNKPTTTEEAVEDTEAVLEVSLSPPIWQWPSENKVLKEYGVVLWPTYEDWRMHDGIDIYVDENGKVGAAADGVVSSITWDEKWGHLIAIEHGDNYVTLYKGEGQVLVTIGESLAAGDSVMVVEESSLMEMALPNHIHFVIKHNGKTIDPVTLLPVIS